MLLNLRYLVCCPGWCDCTVDVPELTGRRDMLPSTTIYVFNAGLTSEDRISIPQETEGLPVLPEGHNTFNVCARCWEMRRIKPVEPILYASLPSAGYAIEWFRNPLRARYARVPENGGYAGHEQDMAVAGA